MGAYLLRAEEISGIFEQHFFHTRIQYNTGQRALVSGVGPPPGAMGVGKIDLDAMNSFGFVLPFSL